MRFYLVSIFCFLNLVFDQAAAACTCGYYDQATGNLFTESLITYFNETTALPIEIFSIQQYEDGYEKSWNARYRNGANSSNVALSESQPSAFYPSNSSLELSLSPSTKLHLVMGGGMKSLRQDIQYGSFRSLMRPSQPWVGGSAMSMVLQYNETQSIQMNTMNTDTPDGAWVNMLVAEEFPDRSLGVNYTVILNDTEYHGISPWDYTEYRYDWTEERVDYYIGNVLARSATEQEVGREKFPSTPSALYLKHWSNGDPYNMGGPPPNRTVGNVGWTRAFFNSSLMTKAEHENFDSRCRIADACSMDDFSLRGSSEYPAKALFQYKPSSQRSFLRMFAVWVLVSSVSVTVLLGCNVIYQRWPTKQSKCPKPEKINFCRRLPPQIMRSRFNSQAPTLVSASMTPKNLTRPSSIDLKELHGNMEVQEIGKTTPNSVSSINVCNDGEHKSSSIITISENGASSPASESETSGKTIAPIPVPYQPLGPKKRIDYLAGLISFSTLVVTLIHFTFTFTPAAGMPGEPHHYRSEIWVNKIIAPFLLNQIFVGVFFITSTRFLIEKYLKTGDLIQIAEKAAGRTFRVIVPIAVIAMLEYFLIDCGAIKWLEYLPSVTWSTWPYAVGYTDFAHYLSEVLEVIYLVPNAAPQITYNYCTGVLWTIPVQLQFSWVTLLGVVVVYEIKSPYKRGLYYAFCIINSWYAQSWGSFFWFGILLADMDVTYAYKASVQKHRTVLYPILWISAACAIAGLANDLVTAWTGFVLPAVERGIHPDFLTGLPIAQTPRAGYPDYFFPRFNGLVFSVGLQVLVELSPLMQKVFSIQPFLVIFPHIFTIYLIHGMIFWSLGAAIAVHLSADGWPYWASILVVGLSCYAVLFLSLPLLTPVVETLGKNVTANIWTWIHESPASRKVTLFPFGQELLFEDKGGDQDEEMGGEKEVKADGQDEKKVATADVRDV